MAWLVAILVVFVIFMLIASMRARFNILATLSYLVGMGLLLDNNPTVWFSAFLMIQAVALYWVAPRVKDDWTDL